MAVEYHSVNRKGLYTKMAEHIKVMHEVWVDGELVGWTSTKDDPRRWYAAPLYVDILDRDPKKVIKLLYKSYKNEPVEVLNIGKHLYYVRLEVEFKNAHK